MPARLLDRPFFALARALTRAAAPAALLRAAPPFAALGLASTILFAGYGMSARDVLGLMRASPAARAALWAAWLLLVAPAARALLAAPTTFVLRALPAPRAWFLALHGAHLVALQLPWAILFARGAGPLACAAASVAAASASALLAARPRRPVEVAASLAVAAPILLGAPSWLLLLSGAAAAPTGLAAAFDRAPERPAEASRATLIAGSAPVALALTHAAVLLRRDAVTLSRGVAAAAVGAVIAALAARNNGISSAADRAGIALAAGALPLALATGGVAARVLVTERGLGWLLLSTAASVRLRAFVATAVCATWGALAGAVQGALGAALMAPDVRLALLGPALGASLGAVAAHLARRAEQPTGVDGTAIVVGMAVAGLLAAALGAWLGALALAPVALAALVLGVSTAPLLRRRERLSEHVLRVAWEEP